MPQATKPSCFVTNTLEMAFLSFLGKTLFLFSPKRKAVSYLELQRLEAYSTLPRIGYLEPGTLQGVWSLLLVPWTMLLSSQ